ncbi:uncharacterized protein A4U43_C09F13950 [Asparagus officinalis]|uniref:Uncharacterized protein n=1 Tax=Asparagus officinalis TaxID=4686 RepID=A0A5P1E998_ASPOF|nr:uncharacterized protein A4U43_C09F13950 [Asparagus officinalis]
MLPNPNSFYLNAINTQSPSSTRSTKKFREMASKGFLCIALILISSLGSAFSSRVIGFPPGPNPMEENPLSSGSVGLEILEQIAPSGPSRGHNEIGGFGAVQAYEGQSGKYAARISGFRVHIPIREDPVTSVFRFTGSKHEVPSGGNPINNGTPHSGRD